LPVGAVSARSCRSASYPLRDSPRFRRPLLFGDRLGRLTRGFPPSPVYFPLSCPRKGVSIAMASGVSVSGLGGAMADAEPTSSPGSVFPNASLKEPLKLARCAPMRAARTPLLCWTPQNGMTSSVKALPTGRCPDDRHRTIPDNSAKCASMSPAHARWPRADAAHESTGRLLTKRIVDFVLFCSALHSRL
jgi:hypothetical protein